MIKIYRFSKDGFEFKEQTHHLNLIQENVKFLKSIDKEDFSIEIDENTLEHYSNIDTSLLSFSLHAFIGKPTVEDKKFYLNHLTQKEIEKVELFSCYIDINSLVFTDTTIVGILERYSLVNVSTLKDKKSFPIIVPSNVTLYNIKKEIF